MRILHRSVTSLARHKVNSTCNIKLTYGWNILLRSSTSLFLLNSHSLRLETTGTFIGPNKFRDSTTKTIRRTFQSTIISAFGMPGGKNIDTTDDNDDNSYPAKSRTRRSTESKKSNTVVDTPNVTDVVSESIKKRRITKKNASTAINSIDEDVDDVIVDEQAETTTVAKKAKLPPHQVITERDEIPKLWSEEKAKANGSYTFKVASWNVAGLRAVLNKSPNVFNEFVKRHDIDVLCLQETKLQEQHLDDPKLKIKETMGILKEFDDYWSCSTAKKGYSGTAIFIRRRSSNNVNNAVATGDNTKVKGSSGKKQTSMMQFVKTKPATNDDVPISGQVANGKEVETLPIDVNHLIPTNISYVMGNEKHDMEGRFIVAEYPLFTLCNVYVPNAGQNLERLSYRVNEWDKDFLNFMDQKRKERNGLPVIWLGDLNVAHTNLEVWNDGAKHLAKQAGVTAEERASFQEQLDAGHIDAFRHLHTTAAGHYSYWSMRAGNRGVNKGLRLDYFICDPNLFDENSQVIVRDCYMDATQEGSDHCPVILEMEIKGSS